MSGAFKHGEFEIEVTGGGEFVATIHGVRVRKSSLSAMKAHIDKLGKSKFVPVQCFEEASWKYPQGNAFTVVGIAKSKSKYSHIGSFLEANGAEHSQPMIDTPENRQRYKELEEFRKESKRLNEIRDKREEELEEAIARLDWKAYQ